MGGLFSPIGALILIAGVVQRDLANGLIGLVIALLGSGALTLTLRGYRILILSPEGLSIYHRENRIDIPWDALAEVHAWSGKFAGVTLRWWNPERTRNTDLSLSVGTTLAPAIESAIKRCWQHPERRSHLQRVSP